ncbi:hypothetical protein BDZ89DRAFT_1035506 [Hymenopellis radicata]|nr:hypothetical protein BDZ89DRAFT_1035506 [Hymenopellis radicata]
MLQGASVRTIGSACGHAKHAVGPAFQCRILFDFYSNHSLLVKIAPLYPQIDLKNLYPEAPSPPTLSARTAGGEEHAGLYMASLLQVAQKLPRRASFAKTTESAWCPR